jgi:hypothetical protein
MCVCVWGGGHYEGYQRHSRDLEGEGQAVEKKAGSVLKEG